MRTLTLATVAADDDAIKLAFAGALTPQTFSGVSLDGVIGVSLMTPPRTITVKTTAVAVAYVVGSTVVVTGLDDSGRVVSETFTLTAAGGGETLAGSVGFSQITSIVVATQAIVTAQFKIGIRDVLFGAEIPTALRFGATGNIKLGYADGSVLDTITTLIIGEQLPLRPKRIYGDASTTTSKVTLVF